MAKELRRVKSKKKAVYEKVLVENINALSEEAPEDMELAYEATIEEEQRGQEYEQQEDKGGDIGGVADDKSTNTTENTASADRLTADRLTDDLHIQELGSNDTDNGLHGTTVDEHEKTDTEGEGGSDSSDSQSSEREGQSEIEGKGDDRRDDTGGDNEQQESSEGKESFTCTKEEREFLDVFLEIQEAGKLLGMVRTGDLIIGGEFYNSRLLPVPNLVMVSHRQFKNECDDVFKEVFDMFNEKEWELNEKISKLYASKESEKIKLPELPHREMKQLVRCTHSGEIIFGRNGTHTHCSLCKSNVTWSPSNGWINIDSNGNSVYR